MLKNDVRLSEQSQNQIKTHLLNRLLDSLKQCQSHFGSKKELATESDSRISCLLAQLEAVFHHGLRKRDVGHAYIRIVTDILPLQASEVALWHILQCILSQQEICRFNQLHNVKSDCGKGRSWLRAALNEKTLPKYVTTLLENQPLLSQFYEDWAFLRDGELNATLPQIVAGLASILFALNIDSVALCENNRVPEEAAQILVEATKAPQPIINLRAGLVINTSHRRDHRRKPLVSVVSFEENKKACEGFGNVRLVGSCELIGSNVNRNKIGDQAHPDTYLNLVPGNLNNIDQSIDESLMSLSPESSCALMSKIIDCGEHVSLSANSCENDKVSPEEVVANGQYYNDFQHEMRMLQKVPFDSANSVHSNSMLPNIDYDVSSDYMSDIYHSRSSCDDGRCQNVDILSDEIASEDSPGTSVMANGIDSCNESTELREELSILKVEMENMRQSLGRQIQTLKQQLDEANNDRDRLQLQLRSYVEAVQLLKQSDEASQDSDFNDNASQSTAVDSTTEQVYEEKLIAVAQMHGELMEFNSQLQKQLHQQQNINHRLRAEMISLRGPISDDSFEDDFSAERSSRLVHIWIPTAFMSGRVPDLHYVYQIYIRVSQSEWNVYRRYSQFKLFYDSLRRRHSSIIQFKFPPKKSMGRLEQKFVEERRKLLEEWLRSVLIFAVQRFPEFLSVSITKESLISVLPFFSDHKNPINR